MLYLSLTLHFLGKEFDMDSHSLGLILFVILLVISFILYGYKSALSHLTENELEQEVGDGNSMAAYQLKFLGKPYLIRDTLLFMVFFMALLVGYYQLGEYSDKLYRTFVVWFGSYLSKYVLKALMVFSYVFTGFYMGFISLGIGVVVPGHLADKYPKTFLKLTGLVRVIVTFTYPFTWAIRFLASLILALFNVDPKEDYENVTEEDIKSMVIEGHEQGVLEASEARMINNIFEFDDKDARDIMTHRKSITAMDGQMTIREAIAFIRLNGRSRFPVFYENIDNIIGVIYFKDLMLLFDKDDLMDTPVKDVKQLLRKPVFLPETSKVDDMFRLMQKEHTHLTVIVDEYGQTSGIVTMEDVLEEIVGNIFDEYDVEEKHILRQRGNEFLVSGQISLEDFSNTIGIPIDSEEYDTLNGYLISKLDRIPEADEKPQMKIDGIHYQVLSIENNIISKVKVIIPSKKNNIKKEVE